MHIELAITALLAGALLGGWIIGQFLVRLFSFSSGGYFPPAAYRPVPAGSGNFGWLPFAAVLLLLLWILREQEPAQPAPEKQEQLRMAPPVETQPASSTVQSREAAFYVQLGEFYREADAERFSQAWQERSADPVQLWHFGEDDAPYKVLAGPFSENDGEVERFLQTHRSNHYRLRVSR